MEEKKKVKIGILLSMILVLLVFVSLPAIISSCSGGGGNNSSSYNSNKDPYNAWICAQDLVQAKLKSPSTAKFPTYSSKYIKNLHGSDFEIKAYVDSQNGFGATVRTQFTVTLTLSGTGYINGYCFFV